VIHVVGQVRRPGVVKLPAGARVDDAVEAAGGALDGADLTRVNLARMLVDGEQLFVPRPGEEVPAQGAGPPAGGGQGEPAGPGGQGAGAGEGAGQGGLVNVNTATSAQLEELPGVGPVLAGRILEWREQNGRFSSVDELGEVSGIGPKVLERLRPLVTV
jgi:competence protein ComEA